MSMIVGSFRFGASGPPPGTLLAGATTGNGANAGTISPGFQMGSAFQAVASGMANTIHVLGSTANASTANFRLCIYDATSQTVWSGALLGNTAPVANLGVDEVKDVPLLSPVPVVAGNWYALTVQPDANVFLASPGNVDERYFSDAYADGPMSTAGASGLNSPSGCCIWITT